MKKANFEERKRSLVGLSDGGYEMIVYSGINGGEEVPDGFGGVLVAPMEIGRYDLWEAVSEDNCHSGWVFRRV